MTCEIRLNTRIGVDFDNTIVGYDRLFANLANERGLNTTGLTGKREIRDALRRRKGGDVEWQKLQALAYGERMPEAELITGFDRFMAICRDLGVPLSIVSHKTCHSNQGNCGLDLREAALGWMQAHCFFDHGSGLSPDDVHFGNTRHAKISRIAQLSCTVFIDDLIEVFSEPAFPASIEAILYDPHADARLAATPQGRLIHRYPQWDQIAEHVFGRN